MPDPIEQPQADPADTTPNAAADTTPAAPEATTDTPPPVDPVEATLAAMTGEPVPAAEPVAAAPAADAVPATPEVVPDPAKEPAKPTPEEAKAKVDAEMADLGIKNERAAARFRDLSTKAAEVEPLKAQLQQLEVYKQRAVEWEEAVTSTGATPEQFGMTMNYLTLLNSGNPDNLEVAFAQIEEEYRSLAKLLGKDAAGVDPLEAHPDLQAKVAAMDIDRDTALELANRRNKEKIGTVSATVRNDQDAAARAQTDGLNAVAALGAELRAADPQFDAKFAIIAPLVTDMQQMYPPDQWTARIRQMWARIPAVAAPAPVVVPPRTTVAPLRPAATSAGQIRSFDDPVDATLAAMAGARQV